MSKQMKATRPSTYLEQLIFASGARWLAGVDEVGRGAWAGPLSVGLALADISRLYRMPKELCLKLKDPKSMTRKSRFGLRALVEGWLADYRVIHIPASFIDEKGLEAAFAKAVSSGLNSLAHKPDVVLIDGKGKLSIPFPHSFVVGADATSMLVACAALLAKTARDQLMIGYSSQYPYWSFANHVGYGTRDHENALWGWGLSALHRRSWLYTQRLPWHKG